MSKPVRLEGKMGTLDIWAEFSADETGQISVSVGSSLAKPAPPKPMSAEEGARFLARMCDRNDIRPGSITMQVNLETHPRGRERRGDRAVESHRRTHSNGSVVTQDTLARARSFPDAIRKLKGRCHEVQP
jgi:hypothetical protein